MSRTIKNTIAGFIGLGLTSGLTLLFSILYFRVLGSENFGLVSFCTTVLLVGNLFVDLGLGRTVVRELARREHNPALAQEMRDALFTLQVVHFSLAVCCGGAVSLSAAWLASQWLNRDTVDVATASQALSLLGIVAALQLPRELCRSALAGLQKQVLSNSLASLFSGVRGVSTLAALFAIAPTPYVFLVTQVLVSILETGTLLIAAWKNMPKRERRPHFDTRILKDVAAFAIGDGLALVLGVGMFLGDRVILSRLLPLDVFGSYSLVVMIAEIILRIVGPFSSAYLPHFADLIARADERQLSQDYRAVSVVASAFMMPASLILIVFADNILQLMMGQAATAAVFAPVLVLRVLGNAIIGSQYLPHTMQLAAGVSATALYVNILNVFIYLPGMLYLTPIYGVLAPAFLWVVIVSIQTPLMIFVTHRIVLKREAWAWVRESILQPLAVAVALIGISAYLAPRAMSWWGLLPWIATSYLLALIAVVAASTRTRNMTLRLIGAGR